MIGAHGAATMKIAMQQAAATERGSAKTDTLAGIDVATENGIAIVDPREEMLGGMTTTVIPVAVIETRTTIAVVEGVIGTRILTGGSASGLPHRPPRNASLRRILPTWSLFWRESDV